MKVLNNLQPEKVMRYFEEISEIPRESAKEGKIASYMERFARERGLECIRDNADNIIIRKPASKGYEDCDGVILQAHMDMVCVKDKDVEHDFDNDGLELYVKDGLIRAKGTTLGADDGIGVAYGLAVLDSDDIKHPPLEVVFTTAEEIGMVGALAFDAEKLRGKNMISFDAGGFTEGRIYVGCSGNIKVTALQSLQKEELINDASAKIYEITLKGLKGGHAGGEIIKGRANGTVLCGRLLKRLLSMSGEGFVQVIRLQGGDREKPIKNSIPDMFSITVYTNLEKELRNAVAAFDEDIKNEFEIVEDDIALDINQLEKAADDFSCAISKQSLKDAVDILFLLPNGVFSMNKRFVDTPECSSNVGNAEIDYDKDIMEYNFSIRSSKESIADFILEKVNVLAELKNLQVTVGTRLPAWDYDPNSNLKDLVETEYEKFYGTKPRFKVTAASTECSLFKRKIDNLDVISMGPIIYEEHTVNEYMEITSVNELWNFLKDILEKMILLPKRGQ